MVHQAALRLIAALVASAFLVLASAGSAVAKFPYFSVELDPAAPRPGEPITVTVRTWADADHSQPSGLTYEGILADLIQFRRTDAVSRPARVPVQLQMVEPDVFRGRVTLAAGEWTLVAFPHGRGALGDFGPGYPQPMSVVVRDEEPTAGWLAVGLASGAAALAVAVAMQARRMRAPRDRVPSSATTGTARV